MNFLLGFRLLHLSVLIHSWRSSSWFLVALSSFYLRLLGQYWISDARAGFSTHNRDARTDFQLNLGGPGLVTWHRSDVRTMIVSRRLRENPEEHNGNPGGAYEWEGEDECSSGYCLHSSKKYLETKAVKITIKQENGSGWMDALCYNGTYFLGRTSAYPKAISK